MDSSALGLHSLFGSRARGARRAWLLTYLLSFMGWGLVAVIMAGTSYLARALTGVHSRTGDLLTEQLCLFLPFALLTPLVVALGARLTVEMVGLRRFLAVHACGALTFIALEVLIRGLTPYAEWDHVKNDWVGAYEIVAGHIEIRGWVVVKMALTSAAEDILFVYVPLVLGTQLISYYRRMHEGERRKSQLEMQLTMARLEALKGQLQPHFLFNTLHSISALMLTDVPAADRMMTLLSDLLRMSLTGESQMTTLKEELEFINLYLAIEKIRFEDRLRLANDIAPDTLQLEVPRLILQPLVENAVRHAVSKRRDGAEIRVTAERLGDDLVIQVLDTGPGLAPKGAEAAGTGIGLRTTCERLDTLYGADQMLSIESRAEGGVGVRLRIPARLASDGPSQTVLDRHPAEEVA